MKSVYQSNIIKSRQLGFSLMELLIAMVIGLIILSAVLGLFVSMVKSDSDSIKAAQLNQELRGAMSLIIRDIRRAGANGNAAADATDGTPSNPFSLGATSLTIADNNSDTDDAIDNNLSCITYAYDATAPFGTVDPAENFGFRWDSGDKAIETRKVSGGVPTACNGNNWENITDENLVSIQQVVMGGITYPPLRFSDTCVDEAGINIRQITVTLSGALKRDATVARTITETVKLRNDEFNLPPC